MENESIARGDVTAMLARWRAGDEKALDALLPLVYDEIRSLADRLLRRRGTRPTLQSTELANEVLLRFLGSGAHAKDRLHFFALTAHAVARRRARRAGEAIVTHAGARVRAPVRARSVTSRWCRRTRSR